MSHVGRTGRQAGSWKSSHNWPVKLATDLTKFCSYWSSKWPHSMSTHHTPPSTPMELFVVMSILSKMARNSANSLLLTVLTILAIY